MHQGGVTFSETEDKCLRSSPLTLTRVLKAPTQGEEEKRARKRNRVALELPKEATFTAKEEIETEEKGGGWRLLRETSVLSPKDEEEMPTHNRVERWKKRAEEQESSAYELLSLLIKMSSSRKN